MNKFTAYNNEGWEGMCAYGGDHDLATSFVIWMLVKADPV